MFPVFFHNFVETNLSVLFFVFHRIPLSRETIIDPRLDDIETGETEKGRMGRGGGRASLAPSMR